MSRTLIVGGCVLTMGRSNFPEADVLIEDGMIAEIGTGLRARDAELVEAANCIVMPGFIDAHRHVWESLFRNLGDSSEASAADYGPHYGADDVYAATLLGLLGAIDAGITSVVDWCSVARSAEHLDAAMQAHADSGIRSVMVAAASPWEPGYWKEAVRRAASAEDRSHEVTAAGPPDPRQDSLEQSAADFAWAREAGVRIHAHVGRSAAGASVAEMSTRGMLGDDVTLVHCTLLGESELDEVKSTAASVVLTPSSEMAAGFGAPPIQDLIDRGIRPGLGVDVEHAAPGDAFAQMRAIISMQHATVFDRKLAGKAGLPKLLNTREVIRYATVDGALAAGLPETGVLEPGKRADVIVLRADRPNIHPVNDPIGAVVWGMDTSNVDTVLVGGRVVKRGGELNADVGRARHLAIDARERVAGASGMLAGVAGTK